MSAAHDVSEVDCCRFDTDEHLAGSGDRGVEFDEFENFGSTEAAEANGMHDEVS